MIDVNFEVAFKATIGHEGGYVNDPVDKGGETNFGISKRAYPDEDIKNLTLDRAKELYYKDYWVKQSCHLLEGYPDIAIEIFDTSVNMGVGRGGKIFQEALNLSNRNRKDFNDIGVDGSIGAKTISAFRSCKKKRMLFNVMNILQGEFYINLMRKNPTYEKYVGWFDRIQIIKK